MNNRLLVASVLLCIGSPVCLAEDAMLWIVYHQNRSTYFEQEDGAFDSNGGSIGFSYAFSDQWNAAINYGELQGDGTWSIDESVSVDIVNRSDVESQSGALSLDWQGEDYRLSFAYSEIEYIQRSLTRRPLLYEVIEGEDRFVSVSYDDTVDWKSLTFGWSVGSQYFDGYFRSQQATSIVPLSVLATKVNRTGWSVFSDFSFGRWIERDTYSWAPQFTVGWNWEVSTEEDAASTVTRDSDRRIFAQMNDRRVNTFRALGSGFWEQSFIFDWHNGWSTSVAFGRSRSADYRVGNLTFDVSVAF